MFHPSAVVKKPKRASDSLRVLRGSRKWALELKALFLFGRRGRTRTCDPLLRRQMLYPPELRAREQFFFDSKPLTKICQRLKPFFWPKLYQNCIKTPSVWPDC